MRISFTLVVVNDKKSVIVLFNLPVFLFSSSPPFPHLTKPHADDTHGSHAELADASSPIIRSLERPGPPTTSGHGRADHTDRMRTRTGEREHWGQRGTVPSSLSPQLCRFLQERLLAEVRQQLWILRHVCFGGGDYFHRKNIFIDKTKHFI